MNNPLFDEEFLQQLDKEREKEIYARITSLSWDENPVEYIEGRIVSGSLNIDATSTIRRSCSLSLVAENVNIHDFYWCLKSKFKLEIGLKNNINKNYPNIIWFDQGLYILTNFNTSLSTTSYNISLSGKDKMCLLNGDLGGSLPQSVDFGVEEYYDNETQITTYNKIPIKKIIREAIHTYGNEPYHNIIINDVDDYGVELLEYRGDENSPLFLYKHDALGYVNMSMNKNKPCYVFINNKWEDEIGDTKITLGNLEELGFKYDNLVELINDFTGKIEFIPGTTVKFSLNEDAKEYTIAKIEYGQTAGYRLTELIYPDDLICNAGEPLTAMLDKIKSMLGDYEYFYDLDGKFVFQRTKTYLSNPWNPIVKLEDRNDLYVESSAFTTAYSYTFHDSYLFNSISNNPQLNNIKNDISIWGVRKGITGAEIPINLSYALDYKPKKYTTWDGELYDAEQVDWRELIYQMALDYYQHNQDDDFLFHIAEKNSDVYPSGYTGYERYYVDIQGFWRQLYQPPEIVEEGDNAPQKGIQYYIKNNNQNYEKVNWEEIVYIIDPIPNTSYYIKDENGKFGESVNNLSEFNEDIEYYIKEDEEKNTYTLINIFDFKDKNVNYYFLKSDNYNSDTFYNKNIEENPGLLNFWFDFIGEGSEIEKFFIPAIGDRVKVINDNKITGIYFREVPTVIFITNDEWNAMGGSPKQTGYTYIRINDSLNGFFNISSQGRSAHDAMEESLYNYTYAADTINLNMIPIYYLQPNTRISVKDKDSGIHGEYIISKITLSLSYNGVMQITASRVPEVIY